MRSPYPEVLVFFMLIFTHISPLYAQSWDEREDEGAAAREMLADETMAMQETEGSIQGIVLAVNNATRFLVVKEDEYDNNTYTFSITQNTDFTVAESLADLSMGDRVQVDYYVIEGRMVADSVDLEERASSDAPSKEEYKLQKVLED